LFLVEICIPSCHLQLLSRRRAHGLAGPRGLLLLSLTTLPILVVGFLLHGIVKKYLFNNTNVVAIGLGVGGIAILLIERWLPRARCYGLGALRWREALTVGLCQCLAVWPGTSRSAALSSQHALAPAPVPATKTRTGTSRFQADAAS